MAPSAITGLESDLAEMKITRPEFTREDNVVRAYLLTHSDAFQECDELRERGWKSAEGDAVYKRKYALADQRIKHASEEQRYYDLYRRIAKELQEATGAFTVAESLDGGLRGLNLCMAPGGYTKALLDHNPRMTVSGITLSTFKGGHPVMPQVAKDPRVEVQYLDMNLLATVMGVPISDIPPDHPDAPNFYAETPFQGQTYDIVIADGAVLRTHTREEYRMDKEREALRLRAAQLVFGLERLKIGGTFILLSHRIDTWENLALLRNFEQFATVKVHKPTQTHTQSSSFYVVAKNVRMEHPMAKAVLAKWKKTWYEATFGGEDGTGETPMGPAAAMMVKAVGGYGPRLIELGTPVWKIQAEALARQSYMPPRRQITLPE